MELPLSEERFAGKQLVVRTRGLFSASLLLQQGSPLPHQKNRYQIKDIRGVEATIQLKDHPLDPIPKVYVDGHLLHLAKPLRWFEYCWMGLPIFLAFQGGLLGIVFGGPAMLANFHIFRSGCKPLTKYLLSGLISAGSTAAYVTSVLFAVVSFMSLGWL